MKERVNMKNKNGTIEENRGWQIQNARQSRSLVNMGLAGACVVLGLVMLAADIYFTYLPLCLIFPEAFAWAFSALTSPIETVGMDLLTVKYLKSELTKAERWLWLIMVPCVLVGDIVTNWWGLHGFMVEKMGTEPTTAHWAMIIVFGTVMAVIEYIIFGALLALGRHRAIYKEACAWLEQHEAEWEQKTSRTSTTSRRDMPPMPRQPKRPARGERAPSRTTMTEREAW